MSTSSHTDPIGTDRLHGGWLEHKSDKENKWKPVWCILKRDGTLFFFSSQETSLDSHIGTLHLSRDCSFRSVSGNPKEGFRFDLYIQRKKKKLRVKKQYDREMWRGYLEAVITGTVPEDVTLSPQDLEIICSKFQQMTPFPPTARRASAPAMTGEIFELDGASSASSSSSFLWQGNRGRPSQSSLASTDTGSSGDGGFDPPGQHSPVQFSLDGASHNSFDSGVIDNTGGPFMTHKFDKEGSSTPPSWFFKNCDRSQAERILTDCLSQGNTLMRVSGTARPSGSYVISKRLESANQIVHYEVIRVAEGYKINAQNSTKTLNTLGEVMNFFIQLSGPTTTLPMKTNDLAKLGIRDDPYYRGPIGAYPGDRPEQTMASHQVLDQDNYEVPQHQQQGHRRAATIDTPVVMPPVPPPPPPPCPSSTSSPLKGGPFKTLGKERAGVRWQSDQTGAVASKTFGPADRRQMRPDAISLNSSSNSSSNIISNSSSSSSKPSMMQVHQNLQEHHVVANLDAVLTKEEERFRHGESEVDSRPPLPVVPANRPKLCGPASSGYVNIDAPPREEDTTDGRHARWTARSQSLPALNPDPLNARVPARVVPPSVVRPGPPGFPKSDTTVSVPAKAENSLQSKLQDELRQRIGRQVKTFPSEEDDPDEDYQVINPYGNID